MGGVLGPLIPPSIHMILIGALSGDSVGKLFMAGMLPGILLAVIFSAYIIFRCSKDKDLVKIKPATWSERWKALRESLFGIIAPFIILGGIYGGIFTPTEAAGVGIIYSLLICGCIYKTLSFRKLWSIILEGAKLNAAILLIVAGALVFGQVVTLLQVPEKIVAFIIALPISQIEILFIILIFIIILGALMDEGSILLITYPILFYIFVNTFGFDSIWFAVVFVFTLEVGLVAPPVGINLFVLQGIWPDAKFDEVVKGVLPFVFLMIASILLVVYIKPLSILLPRLMR
jgi:C4-dicarboxylate transporter DctM subunit